MRRVRVHRYTSGNYSGFHIARPLDREARIVGLRTGVEKTLKYRWLIPKRAQQKLTLLGSWWRNMISHRHDILLSNKRAYLYVSLYVR